MKFININKKCLENQFLSATEFTILWRTIIQHGGCHVSVCVCLSRGKLCSCSQGDTKVKGLTLPNVRNVGSDISDSVRSVRPFISNHTFCTKNA